MSKLRLNKDGIATVDGNSELQLFSKESNMTVKKTISAHTIRVNKTRRKAEDKMATLFMVIVVVFIACHLPRSGYF